VTCIQPDLQLESSSPRILQTGRSQSTVFLDGFMRRGWLDAFGSGSFASREDVGFRANHGSYLRLKAYSFFWLCEGA
jgi:hypothetical protein